MENQTNFIEENRKKNLLMDIKILIGIAITYFAENNPEALYKYKDKVVPMSEDCLNVVDSLEQETDEELVEILIEMYEEYCKE